MLGQVTGDVRWAVRLAARRPGATVAVAGTLALAIAAATIAYAVATAILWKPLPFRDASRLVFLWEAADADGGPRPQRVTSGRYVEWRDGRGPFQSMAAFGAAGFTLDAPAGAVPVRGVRVSVGYFDTLGISPLVGRAFSPADGTPGRHFVVVLSHALWRERFGGRTTAIGESLRLAGQPYTVIGVMPPVVFPAWPVNPAAVTLDPDSREFWVPIPRTPAFDQNTRSHVFGVVARLAEGASIEQATAALAAPAPGAAGDPHGGLAAPFRDQFVRDARQPILALVVATLAVLLVACANLAALQATLVEARRGELDVRLALGAGAGRVARQLLAESLVLALAGGAAGLALARAGLAMVPALLPGSVPLLTTPTVDGRVWIFGAGVSVAAGLLMAAWPLGKLAGAAVSPRGAVARPRPHVYRALVIGQVAATVALAVAAGLLSQSLWSVQRRDPGFAIDGVVVANITVPGSPTAREAARFEQQLLDRAAALGGASHAAAAYDHPLEANWTDAYTLAGDDRDEPGSAQLRIVSPGYHDALGVQVLDGRAFTARDDLDAPGVALVNEALARELRGGAIGRRLRTSAPRGTWGAEAPAEFTIVGVVENERVRGLEGGEPPAVYLSTRQFPQQAFTLIVRSAGKGDSPLFVAAGIKTAVGEVSRAASVDTPRSLQSILDEQLVTRSVTADLLAGLSGAALTLSALGVYGLLAVTVAGRTREIGVRLALGAPPGRVGRQVVADSLVNGAAGVGVGLALAWAVGRALESLLVGVAPSDPWTLGVVALTVLATTAAAAVVPARRATRVDPAVTLRCE